MNSTFDAKELQDLLHNLTGQGALTEAAVLIGCLGLSWLVCFLLRKVLKIHGAVLFGSSVVDGVLFPVFALVMALVAREFLKGMVTVAVFKVAIPILTSLVLIRLTVRVLSAAFPTTPGCVPSSAPCPGSPGSWSCCGSPV